MLPLFRAVLKFCSTNRLFTYVYIYIHLIILCLPPSTMSMLPPLLPICFLVNFNVLIRKEYTTFTDRATGDWAEIWGDKTSSFNKNANGKGWLLVIIVRYFTFRSSFLLFSCYCLLICDQSTLRRVFSKLLRVL